MGTEEGTDKFVKHSKLHLENLNVKLPGQRVRACAELHRLDGGGTKGPSAFSTNKVATGSDSNKKKTATSVQNFFGGSAGGGKAAEKKDSSTGKPPLSSNAALLGPEPTRVIPSPKKDLKRAPRGNDGSPIEGLLPSISEEEEDEWDDGTGYKTDKSSLRKRGKIVADDDDDAEDESHPIDTTLTEEDQQLIAR
jgi:hypothetical protein